MSTDSNLILTESVKYSLCSDVVMTFFKIIIMPFSEEDQYLIQFYRKTRHLGAHRIIKLSRKEIDIKRVAKIAY